MFDRSPLSGDRLFLTFLLFDFPDLKHYNVCALKKGYVEALFFPLYLSRMGSLKDKRANVYDPGCAPSLSQLIINRGRDAPAPS